MKTKLKYLFLALLGLILIPNTYAYELSEIRNWSESWAPPTTTRHRGMCLHYNRDWYMTFDGKGYSYADISRDNTSCSEWAVLGNFFAPRDYNSPWYEQIYNDYFSYVNSKQNGEWMDMIRTVYQNGEHKTVITTLPSRTAYKRTSNAGIDYMFTQIYFYHNQFILYDPIKEVGLSFLGKMNVVGGAVFANPGTTEDNLRFVDYVRKKAYSATITNTAAWKWLLGTDVSMSRLQSTNWTKSYTMNKGGSSFLPPNFKIDKQGSEWFQYIEDIEFTAPDWNAGKPNNNTENNLEAYNNCLSYYWEVHNLARLWDKCSWDGKDEQAMDNFLAIQHWNWEWDAPELKGNSAFLCSVFAKYKKKYKEKHTKDWWKFEQEREEYMFNPDWLVPVNRCQSFKNGEDKKWYQNIWDFLGGYWNKITWKEKIWEINGKQVSKSKYDRSLIKLWTLKQKCDNPWLYMSFVPFWKKSQRIEEFRKKFCDEYNQALSEHNKKYDWLKINEKYAGDYWTGEEVDNLGLSKLMTYFSPDYESGFNFVAGKIWVCKNPVLSEEWDFLVYIPFFLISFYIVKYLFF